VVVVHDDSVWGGEGAAAFIKSLRERVQDSVVLNANPDTTAFPLAEFDAGQLNATNVLDEIARVRGRIVYAAVNSRMMRAIFAAFHARVVAGTDTWFQRHADFVWLLGFADEQIFRDSVRRRDSQPWPAIC
jgi:hypothetical protein